MSSSGQPSSRSSHRRALSTMEPNSRSYQQYQQQQKQHLQQSQQYRHQNSDPFADTLPPVVTASHSQQQRLNHSHSVSYSGTHQEHRNRASGQQQADSNHYTGQAHPEEVPIESQHEYSDYNGYSNGSANQPSPNPALTSHGQQHSRNMSSNVTSQTLNPTTITQKPTHNSSSSSSPASHSPNIKNSTFPATSNRRMPSTIDSQAAEPVQKRSSDITNPVHTSSDSKHSRTKSHSGTQSSQSSQIQQPPKVHKRRSIGDWDLIKTVGAGSMGQVKLARNRRTNEFCAVKVVPRASVENRRRQQQEAALGTQSENKEKNKESDESKDIRTVREAAIGKLLKHPYICNLYEMHIMSSHYYMLFEYVSGGQLLDYIIAHGSLKEKQARKFARAIASALDYCHHNSIVHRDLKIENILISNDGEVKIIDFGLSNLFSSDSLLKTFCGSLYFAAPELLSAFPYCGPEIDVWSFGVVLYVLVCGKVPFDDQSMPALHAKIKRGFVEYPTWISSECRDLLSRMLVVDPHQRATLSEVRNHPWMIKGYDKPPDSFLPSRRPLHLPLDPSIIEEMTGFEFGDADSIAKRLTQVLESPQYIAACKEWYRIHGEGNENDDTLYTSISHTCNSYGGNANAVESNHHSRHSFSDFYRRSSISADPSNDNTGDSSKSFSAGAKRSSRSSTGPTKLPDPTNAYHPLISIYYLVSEKLERERAKSHTAAVAGVGAGGVQMTPSTSKSSAHSSNQISTRESTSSHTRTASANQSFSYTSAYANNGLPPTSPGGPTAPNGHHQLENKKKSASSQTSEAHSSSANGPQFVSKVRTRSKTQSEGGPNKFFSFDSNAHPINTTRRESGAGANTIATSNYTPTNIVSSNTERDAQNTTGLASAHSNHNSTSSGGTSFATSLLRRWSSRRRANKDSSAPANNAPTAYQKQAQQAQAYAQAQQTHAQVEQYNASSGVARTQSRHKHSQSAIPAFNDVPTEKPSNEKPNDNQSNTISHGSSDYNQRNPAYQNTSYGSANSNDNHASTSVSGSGIVRTSSSKRFAKPAVAEPPQSSFSEEKKTSSFSRKFHPSARAKSLGHAHHELSSTHPARSSRDDALRRKYSTVVNNSSNTRDSIENDYPDAADEYLAEYYNESRTDQNINSNVNNSIGGASTSNPFEPSYTQKDMRSKQAYENAHAPITTGVSDNIGQNTAQSQLTTVHHTQHQQNISRARTSRHAHSQSVSVGPAHYQNNYTPPTQSNSLATTTSTQGMPSIECPKQVFLKGFFSVQSTSTKPLAYFRSDLIRALTQLGVEFHEIRGGFECTHIPTLKEEMITSGRNGTSNSYLPNNSAGGNNNTYSPPHSPMESSSGGNGHSGRGHWRKLSFGSGLFSSRKGLRAQNESQNNITDFASDLSTDSVAGGAGYYGMNNNNHPSSNSGAGALASGHANPPGGGVSGTSASNMNAMSGGSDLLMSATGAPSSRLSQSRTPVQFEIWIVKVPLLQLHGVQFKKLRGNSWLYKNLATKILSELRL